jgi:4'-phosphopantetheinyl transferase
MDRATREGECGQGLRPGRMYLWTALTGGQNLSGLEELLSTRERRRARRFRRDSDSSQFVIAHALVRVALSYHFAIPKGDWQFDCDPDGKPVVTAPELLPAVQFSLSHTDGLVACLITLSAEAAVDVEKIQYHRDLALVSHQMFSPTELKALRALPRKDWTTRFFAYWTLKEAITKAQGRGLALTFSDISFDLGANNWIRADLVSAVGDGRSMWILWRQCSQSQHAIAVAVKRDFDGECEIIHRTVKFEGARIVFGRQARHIEFGNGPTDCQGEATP